MSKLSIDQRNIKALFQDRKSDFLIPDYQRPYAWDESKCETLWEDLFAFALPGENIENFNEDDEYFLGPIVTYQNDDKHRKRGKREAEGDDLEAENDRVDQDRGRHRKQINQICPAASFGKLPASSHHAENVCKHHDKRRYGDQ